MYKWQRKKIKITKGSTIFVAREYLLNLKGGTEYVVPKKSPRQYREVVMRSAFINRKINKPPSKLDITKNHACFIDRSPAGIGK